MRLTCLDAHMTKAKALRSLLQPNDQAAGRYIVCLLSSPNRKEDVRLAFVDIDPHGNATVTLIVKMVSIKVIRYTIERDTLYTLIQPSMQKYTAWKALHVVMPKHYHNGTNTLCMADITAYLTLFRPHLSESDWKMITDSLALCA